MPEESKEEIAMWVPKTDLGREVFEGKIMSIDEIFKSGRKIKEPQIIDYLLPNLQHEIIFIGGSPGKGGGIKRTPTKRTARMHRSGRRYRIIAVAIVGNCDGYFGVGKSESSEHREAISKATVNAKLNIIPVKRGCGSWECACGENHSIPFTVEGKEGSIRVVLKPAPKGIRLCMNDEAKKILRLAGISDIWSKSFGNTGTRINYVFAIFDAFKKMNKIKIPEKEEEKKKAKKAKKEEEAEKKKAKKAKKEEEAEEAPAKKPKKEASKPAKKKKTKKSELEEKEIEQLDEDTAEVEEGE